MGKFVISKNSNGEFTFNLKAGNGEIILSASQTYASQDGCEGGIDSVKKNAQVHVVLEKTTQDQLLKIWNNTSTAYKLSFVVLLTGVEIDSRRERRFTRVTDVSIDTQQKPGGAGR